MNWAALLFALTALAFAKPPVRLASPTPTPEPFIVAVTPTPSASASPSASPTVVVPEESKPFVVAPAAPTLSGAGYQLILNFEVGGGKAYYDRFLARPTWPGLHSGVTIGVGMDLGYNSKAVVLDDWKELPTPHPSRLAATAGVTGVKAKPRAAEVRDILIAWKISEGVFQRITLGKFFAQAQRAFPGFDDLRPNAQAALVSLVFNRGASMNGSGRLEMREIRSLVPKKDYAGIAQ